MHLRILTLNVWNRSGDPRRTRVINRELRRLAPDLMSFQEVVADREPGHLDQLVDGLDVQRTHQVEVMPTVPPDVERYGGMGLATRWPHRIVEVLDLRQADALDVPWCTLAAVVSLPGEASCSSSPRRWSGASTPRPADGVWASDHAGLVVDLDIGRDD
ncbi:MAG TPA: endonuclease/exonuclease/phosphatase family protein [Kofleriaceae bacterium]|nr:endonuclease/exonuclease/phosphatase family protein [Kofleriaceae bacterium]